MTMKSSPGSEQPHKGDLGRVRQRSPLGMAVLAMLAEEPMHAYRMHELIKTRGKASVINVAQRNSVYQTIDRLLRAALIRVQAATRTEGRPERFVYELTDEGQSALNDWLSHMLAVPVQDYPEFPAALAFVMVLKPKQVLTLLQARVGTLQAMLVAERSALKQASAVGLPRLFLIEEEFKQAMLKAELLWVRSLVQELASGEITWNAAWLRDMSRKFTSTGRT